MAKKHEAETLLRQGLIPSQIARHLGVSIGTTVQYLHTRIGEGALRLAEIYYSLAPERREMLQEVKPDHQKARRFRKHRFARKWPNT